MQCLQVEENLVEQEVVSLPRPKLLPSPGRGCIELHVLDLLEGQVVGLSTCDLPGPGKGPPHYWRVGGDSPPIGPPPYGPLRTSHPRPQASPLQSPTRPAPLLLQPETPGASIEQKAKISTNGLASSHGHGGAANRSRSYHGGKGSTKEGKD